MKTYKKSVLNGVVVSILLVGIYFLFRENTTLKRSNSTLKIEKQVVISNNETYGYLNSLTVNSFEKKIENGEDTFVYIGNSTCSDCSNFSKTLKKEVEEFPLKDSMYLVDITTIHSDKDRWLGFKKRYGFDQTPSFLLIEQGKVKSLFQWDEKKGLDEENFHNWLKQNELFIRGLDT